MNEMSKPVTAVSPATLARLIAVVGEKNAITDPEKQTPYLVEFRALWTGHTPVVLRPGSTREVSEILKIANETSTPIVPQGGNTGLVGGQIPHNGEVLLSLNRMDKIREIDPVSNTITCEAGVTLQRAREAAAAASRVRISVTPASQVIVFDTGSISRILSSRLSERRTSPLCGTWPPTRPVLPPWGTIAVEVSFAIFMISETSATDPGRSTTGVCPRNRSRISTR